ncbi:MAG: hypothetical protein K6T88_02365 [Bacillus sp. (in: Bacteria)]|nr:hypothetical protein [Bacillus sp. (in: firmicutes)]
MIEEVLISTYIISYDLMVTGVPNFKKFAKKFLCKLKFVSNNGLAGEAGYTGIPCYSGS